MKKNTVLFGIHSPKNSLYFCAIANNSKPFTHSPANLAPKKAYNLEQSATQSIFIRA